MRSTRRRLWRLLLMMESFLSPSDSQTPLPLRLLVLPPSGASPRKFSEHFVAAGWLWLVSRARQGL